MVTIRRGMVTHSYQVSISQITIKELQFTQDPTQGIIYPQSYNLPKTKRKVKFIHHDMKQMQR
jgi:hypothetical protein